MLCDVILIHLPTIAILIAIIHNFIQINCFMDLIVAYKGDTMFDSIGLNDETKRTSSGSNSGSGQYFLRV